MDPKDKVAVVTGGVSGIGFSIATELLKNGANGVALLDINQEAGQNALRTLEKEYGTKVIFIKCDITNVNEFENAFKETKSKFGDLNILVNSAGIIDTDYKKEIDINLIGVMHGIMLGFQYLSKNEYGNESVIVNLSSAVVFLDKPCYILPTYSATKAAVIELSKSWGHAYHYNRTGIRVIAICPVLVDTPFLKTLKFYYQTLADEWDKLIFGVTPLKPDAVGRTAIYVIKNADSSSVWLITAERKLWKMNYPEVNTMKKLIVDNI